MGGVVASQLEKDWITAARNVSANKNSLWPLGSVLSQHPHPNSHLILPPPPLLDHHIYTPAQTKPGLPLTLFQIVYSSAFIHLVELLLV